MTRLCSLQLSTDADVMRARQQARQIAAELGFDAIDQTRLGSTVLEVCRQALRAGNEGRAELSLDSALDPKAPALVIRVSTEGAALPAVRQALDAFRVDALPATGFCVEFSLGVPAGCSLTPALRGELKATLESAAARSPLEQLWQQDLELLGALEAQRSLELQLARCQAVERVAREEALAAGMAREHVLAVMSHDLRNPLFALTNGAFLLERVNIEGKDGDRVRKSAQMMRRAVDRMDHLISDLLDVEQLQVGNLTLVQQVEDAGALVREALDVCAPQAAERKLRLDGSAAMNLRVCCDRERVLQVFARLLANAIKFTAEGGLISIGAQPLDREVQFLIRDTGRGITDEELPHVFDRFWQAKKRSRNGIGLSLSLVKGLVEAHGGSVGVESRVGVGTAFRFTLPLANGPSGDAAAAENSEQEPQGAA